MNTILMIWAYLVPAGNLTETTDPFKSYGYLTHFWTSGKDSGDPLDSYALHVRDRNSEDALEVDYLVNKHQVSIRCLED